MLNVVACLGVVMLHANGVFWSHPKGSLWISSNLIETVMYWPVPIFFMITGATLLEYRSRYSTPVFFKRRFWRVFIPFLFWSVFAFCVLRFVFGNTDLKLSVSGILNYEYYYIYWFFPSLFAIYLSMPVLNLLSRRWKLIACLLLYTFVSYSILPFLADISVISVDKAWCSPVSAGYILYALLGYGLANVELSKKERIILYCLGIIGWGLHFGGTLALTPDYGGEETISQTFKGYLNFPTVLQASAVFVLFKYTNFDALFAKESRRKLIERMHASTFGIYLIHQYWLTVFNHFDLKNGVMLWRLLVAVIVFALSFVCVQILKQIPVVRRIVP